MEISLKFLWAKAKPPEGIAVNIYGNKSKTGFIKKYNHPENPCSTT